MNQFVSYLLDTQTNAHRTDRLLYVSDQKLHNKYATYDLRRCLMVLIAVVSISDIDECELGYNECTQRCVNFGGAYKCACEPDYQLGTDGKSCYRTSLL